MKCPMISRQSLKTKKNLKQQFKSPKKNVVYFWKKKIARLNHTNIPEIFKDS